MNVAERLKELERLESDLEGLMKSSLQTAKDQALVTLENENCGLKENYRNALRSYSYFYGSYQSYKWSLRRIKMILEKPYHHLD